MKNAPASGDTEDCELAISGRIFKIPKSQYDLLMEHQKEALTWLLQRYVSKKGSILADEMGLGKTISAIALICCLRYTLDSAGEQSGPVLVVCPGTVINQWTEELEIWATDIIKSVTVYNSQTKSKVQNPKASTFQNKKKFLEAISSKNNGVVITSYDQVRHDIAIFRTIPWFQVILDEAQKIKNYNT